MKANLGFVLCLLFMVGLFLHRCGDGGTSSSDVGDAGFARDGDGVRHDASLDDGSQPTDDRDEDGGGTEDNGDAQPVDGAEGDGDLPDNDSDSGQDGGTDADTYTDRGPPPCETSPTARGGNMCPVPAGPFMMGCNASVDDECGAEENPYHEATVPDFMLDAFPVTASEYRACVLSGGCPAARTGESCNYGLSEKGEHPINCLDWDRARGYCIWVGKRLPTEAEWEKAARGTDGRKYPWGNDSLDCDHAVMSVAPCNRSGTAPVGSKPAGASPYQFLDMIGNVWQWVEDGWHENYVGAPSDGSAWSPIPSVLNMTVRGGTWKTDDPRFLRASTRSPDGYQDYLIGFRCAVSPSQICVPDCAGKCGGDDGCGGTCPNNCVPPQICWGGGVLNVCGAVGQNCGPSPTGLGGDMCDVPAGPFMMGCNVKVDDECAAEDLPFHEVSVPEFRIDKLPVTVAEYDECRNSGACTAPKTGSYCNHGVAGRENHPLDCVGWDQAEAYCLWVGKRLPTEAEWEKAARGTDGRKYPWGNDSLDCEHAVWCKGGVEIAQCGCGRGSTAPVGSKPLGTSPFGVMDMIGNVYQWVQDDWHSSYDTDNDGYQVGGDNGKDGPSDGSAWVDNPRGSDRTIRGGNWFETNSWNLRVSDRTWAHPKAAPAGPGFRCAMDGL
ncbi:MAG: SUMF1/EgtB/PvdO family nonheme iron enzyme [Deltaproteobacteria bacterium]|nr:SUMF1/EgtB/PvdO family nonheme iron enzyme [Deltaproteobacteria bacterium]